MNWTSMTFGTIIKNNYTHKLTVELVGRLGFPEFKNMMTKISETCGIVRWLAKLDIVPNKTYACRRGGGDLYFLLCHASYRYTGQVKPVILVSAKACEHTVVSCVDDSVLSATLYRQNLLSGIRGSLFSLVWQAGAILQRINKPQGACLLRDIGVVDIRCI